MDTRALIKNYRIAIPVGFIALVLAGTLYFRSSTFDEMKSALPAREKMANRLADNVRYAQKLDSQREQLEGVNKQVRSRLTDPADVATNQQYFYKLEADTGVKILDVHPAAEKKTSNAIYPLVPFTLNVTGDFYTVMVFVRRLETGSRFCRIVSANMSNGASKGAFGSTPIALALNVEFLGIQ